MLLTQGEWVLACVACAVLAGSLACAVAAAWGFVLGGEG